MDPQFLCSALANAIGGFAAGLGVAIVCLASKRLCRAIIRWRISRLPKGDDADRAAEELDGWAADLTAAERAELATHLLFRSAALSREIAERAAGRTVSNARRARAHEYERRIEEQFQLRLFKVARALTELDPLAAQVVVMKHHGAMTTNAVAGALGIPPHLVRRKLTQYAGYLKPGKRLPEEWLS